MRNSESDVVLEAAAGLSVSRRSILKGGAALLAMPYLSRSAFAAETLYINTWGGRWEESAKKNLFDPFTKETGIEIKTVSPVSYAKLAAQARTGVYEFDCTTVGPIELLQGSEAGIVEDSSGTPVRPDELRASGPAARTNAARSAGEPTSGTVATDEHRPCCGLVDAGLPGLGQPQ